MEVILIVIIFALNLSGDGYSKTKYVSVAPTYEQCELAAIFIKNSPVLNTPSTYVFSAECEFRIKPADGSSL